MIFPKASIQMLIVLCSLFFIFGCGGSEKASISVAAVNQLESTGLNTQKSINVVKGETDEEITTKFTICMRGLGFDTPDPELNQDGSVDLRALKQSFFQDSKWGNGKNERVTKANEECIPLLRGATFSQKPEKEDSVEVQDNLLKFSQCLRGSGLDVPDPDFSGSARGGNMKTLIKEISGSTAKIDKIVNLCSAQIWGSDKGNEKSARKK